MKLGGSKAQTPTLKKKGGSLCINSSKKILKISTINPTYPYVYECIVKIVYYSSEDGNKKFNHPKKKNLTTKKKKKKKKDL